MASDPSFAPPEVRVDCPFCYQSFTTMVDWSGGEHQVLDLDCEVCCHALVVQVTWNGETEEAQCNTEKAF